MFCRVGVDTVLSRHISHLFTRDPLLLYSHTLDVDSSDTLVHFDNLNSSNWNNVRLKPPPIGSSGWRIEFRPMDVSVCCCCCCCCLLILPQLQLTDFENAAFLVFTNLLLRVFLQRKINLYIPISQMQDNFKRAFQRDSCRSGLYHFRSDIFTPLSSDTCDSVMWDINTIVNGKVSQSDVSVCQVLILFVFRPAFSLVCYSWSESTWTNQLI